MRRFSLLNVPRMFYLRIITRVASEAKRAERNEVERDCGVEGGVPIPSASW